MSENERGKLAGEREVDLRAWAASMARGGDPLPQRLLDEYDGVAARVASLEQKRDELLQRVDGDGPQISFGTAAGILQREVAARQAAEAARDTAREALRALIEIADEHAGGEIMSEALRAARSALSSSGGEQ